MNHSPVKPVKLSICTFLWIPCLLLSVLMLISSPASAQEIIRYNSPILFVLPFDQPGEPWTATFNVTNVSDIPIYVYFDPAPTGIQVPDVVTLSPDETGDLSISGTYPQDGSIVNQTFVFEIWDGDQSSNEFPTADFLDVETIGVISEEEDLPPDPPSGNTFVGVLPGFNGGPVAECPPDSERINIFMDNENGGSFQNDRSGWIGATESFANTNFIFCRIPGETLKPLSTSDSVINHYAVLQLSQSCPSGSTSFSRTFNTQNRNNQDDSSGDIFPNRIFEGFILGDGPFRTPPNMIQMFFCLFKSGVNTMNDFPDLGIPYGVFAASDFRKASETGYIITDDEDASNDNRFDALPEDRLDAQRIIQPINNGGRDTRLNMAKVFPEATLPTEPVAKCRVNPTGTLESSVSAVFNDNGSFARGSASIASYDWEFSFGANAIGTGPITRVFYGDQFSSPTIHFGILTVTDTNGETGMAICEVAIIGCDFGNCIEPF